MQDCTGSAAAARRMEGNRSEKSLPLRVISRTSGRIPVRHEAKAVVLYLMNPLWSAGRLLGRTRQARLKAGMGLLRRVLGAATHSLLTSPLKIIDEPAELKSYPDPCPRAPVVG